MLSVAETLNLMIDFGMFILAFISLLFTILVHLLNNKK